MAMNPALMDELNAVCTDSLGQAITVDGISIDAIFDNDYNDLSGMGVGVASSSPYVMCLSSDIGSASEGSDVVVGGLLYRVSSPPEPDGLGMTILRLNEQ